MECDHWGYCKSRGCVMNGRYVFEDLIKPYDRGDYERIEYIIPRTICSYDKNSPIPLPPDINTRVIEILLATGHRCILNEFNHRNCKINPMDRLLTTINNYRLLSDSDQIEIILRSDTITNCMIRFCQLARIPFRLRLRECRRSHGRELRYGFRYGSYVDVSVPTCYYIHGLVADDINNLDDDNRRVMQAICAHQDNIKERYAFDLLRQTNYPSIDISIRIRHSLISISKMLKIRRSRFNQFRRQINNLHLLTNHRFNRYWRRLGPVEILQGHFDPEHLLSIDIEVPHIDLLCHHYTLLKTHNIKLLIRYSTPSYLLIDKLLSEIEDDGTKALEGLLIIAQYKRESLYEYNHLPFIDHLLQVSNRGNMTKNSRSNPVNL